MPKPTPQKVSPTERAVNDTAEAVEKRVGAKMAEQQRETKGLIENLRHDIKREVRETIGAVDRKFDAYEDRLKSTIKNKPYVAATLFLAGALIGYAAAKLF